MIWAGELGKGSVAVELIKMIQKRSFSAEYCLYLKECVDLDQLH